MNIFFRYEGMNAQLNLRCNLILKGKYKANGRVLLFPINGEGDARIKTREYFVVILFLYSFSRSNSFYLVAIF